MPKAPPMDPETAEMIALAALTYLAEDATRLSRFLALTGLEPDGLREAAGSSAMLAAVLEYVLGDESMLLAFAANRAMAPANVSEAHALLSGQSGGLP